MSENLTAAVSSGALRAPLDEDLLSVLRADGTADEEHDPGLDPPLLRSLYTTMVQSRLMDERMILLQRQGRIGFYIGGVGEEACILGSVAAMRPEDWIFPCYREHSAALWRGLPLARFVHNLMGTAQDPVKGRQMPCHEVWRPGNFASISSPIATQVPQAVGAAWAAKKLGHEVAMIVYFGDGATSSNDFHVGCNFAGVMRAPVILFCRNNQWAISTPRQKQTAAPSIASKAEGYGITGVRVDGNDLLACYAATAEARRRAVQGQGPTLIEAVTYRMTGHSTSDDPRFYRKEEEIAPWRKRDPIDRFRHYLEARGLWSEAEESALVEGFKAELTRIIKEAEAAPAPPLASMFEEVYARPPWHLVEQQAEALSFAGGR